VQLSSAAGRKRALQRVRGPTLVQWNNGAAHERSAVLRYLRELAKAAPTAAARLQWAEVVTLLGDQAVRLLFNTQKGECKFEDIGDMSLANLPRTPPELGIGDVVPLRLCIALAVVVEKRTAEPQLTGPADGDDALRLYIGTATPWHKGLAEHAMALSKRSGWKPDLMPDMWVEDVRRKLRWWRREWGKVVDHMAGVATLARKQTRATRPHEASVLPLDAEEALPEHGDVGLPHALAVWAGPDDGALHGDDAEDHAADDVERGGAAEAADDAGDGGEDHDEERREGEDEEEEQDEHEEEEEEEEEEEDEQEEDEEEEDEDEEEEEEEEDEEEEEAPRAAMEQEEKSILPDQLGQPNPHRSPLEQERMVRVAVTTADRRCFGDQVFPAGSTLLSVIHWMCGNHWFRGEVTSWVRHRFIAEYAEEPTRQRCLLPNGDELARHAVETDTEHLLLSVIVSRADTFVVHVHGDNWEATGDFFGDERVSVAIPAFLSKLRLPPCLCVPLAPRLPSGVSPRVCSAGTWCPSTGRPSSRGRWPRSRAWRSATRPAAQCSPSSTCPRRSRQSPRSASCGRRSTSWSRRSRHGGPRRSRPGPRSPWRRTRRRTSRRCGSCDW